MDCDRVRLLLNGYVDGELDLVTSLEIEQHLRGCAGCEAQHRSLMKVHALTSDKELYHTAPAGLEKRIQSALRKADPAPSRWAVFSGRWPVFAALAVVVLIIVGLLGSSLLGNSQEARLTQEVQAAHLRSLMANHLVDVASSDQHTVKPWFDGKLDFSPPVTDLAAQGFPLVGGRLDFLDGQPVAALVYRRNKHDINLFIWPGPDKPAGLQSSTANGYHVYHWNQAGMTFWAVSDLNESELLEFIHAYQKSALAGE